MTPEKIGKYTVIELLGRGGMGEVYLGEDPYIGRRVAIKIIKGADPEARDRFLHEARVIGGLAHPAIVSLLDFDFSGDEPFLVMELLKGQGLDAWLRNPRSMVEQLVVLEDLCQALSYAHENGVLHRDVKPSNVQVLPNGHAKLMDFGIARAAAGKLTKTGAIMGTPEYMAPEILNDVAYSARSDLYASAVLLYEMFTGKNPFAAGTVAATLTNVLHSDPPDLRQVRPDLPPQLSDTLMACLRKQPELRPAGFGALIAAGREASRGTALSPPPETRAIRIEATPSLVPPTSTPASQTARPKPPYLVWIGGAGAFILGVAWLLSQGFGPRETAIPTPSPKAAVALETSSAAVQPAGPGTPSPSPIAAPSPPPSHRDENRDGTSRGRPIVAPTRLDSTPAPVSQPTASQAPPDPVPTPTPAVPAPTQPLSVVHPTPMPSAAVTTEPSRPAISVSSVSPRTLRRGSSVDLEVQGEGLRKGLKAVVMQGRRPATGIRVVKTEFVNSRIIRVRILIEAETPLLTYALMLQDEVGALTPGLQIEVVL